MISDTGTDPGHKSRITYKNRYFFHYSIQHHEKNALFIEKHGDFIRI